MKCCEVSFKVEYFLKFFIELLMPRGILPSPSAYIYTHSQIQIQNIHYTHETAWVNWICLINVNGFQVLVIHFLIQFVWRLIFACCSYFLFTQPSHFSGIIGISFWSYSIQTYMKVIGDVIRSYVSTNVIFPLAVMMSLWWEGNKTPCYLNIVTAASDGWE